MSSQSAHPTAPQPTTQPTSPVPYVGSRISLISKSAIRYVGTLYTIDTKASTVALKDVRSFGTEGRTREGGPVEPSDRVYSFIVFRGPDILDLQFLSTDSVPALQPPVHPQAPAVQNPAHQKALESCSATPVPQTATSTHLSPPQIHMQPQTQSQPQLQQPQQISKALSPQQLSPVVHHASPHSAHTSEPRDPSPKTPRSLRGPTPRAWGPPPAAVRCAPSTPSLGLPNGGAMNNPVPNGVVPHLPATNTAVRNEATLNSMPVAQRNSRSREPGRRGRGRGRSGPRPGGSNGPGWRRGPGITIPEEDFDFESMHEKFNKASLAESFAVADGSAGDANSASDMLSNGGDANSGFPQAVLRYDKAKSFFDELLPEKEVRSEKPNAAQRRATDFETFGETGPGYRNGYRNRGRRGRGRGRGRGGRFSSTAARSTTGRQEAR